MSSSFLSLLDWARDNGNDGGQRDSGVLVLDGGVSTYLESIILTRNKNMNQAAAFSIRALWSSSLLLTKEGQNDIRNCHTTFYNAGADIVSTVTYQCHFESRLYNTNTTTTTTTTKNNKNDDNNNDDNSNDDKVAVNIDHDRMTTMMADAVRLAREGGANANANNNNNDDDETGVKKKQKKKKWVVASTGCYGAALADGSEYRGNYGLSVDQLINFHQPKAMVLMQQMPDALAFETVPCAVECEAIVKLLKEQQQKQQQKPPLCVWISFACQNGSLLNDGSPFEDALDILDTMDPNAELVHGVGINCCDSLYVPSLLQILVQHNTMKTKRRKQNNNNNNNNERQQNQRFIVVYPNSGEQWDAKNETWLEGTGCTTPAEFANRMINAIRIIMQQQQPTKSSWNDSDSNNDDSKQINNDNDNNQESSGNDNGNNNDTCSLLPFPKVIIGGCCRTSPDTIAAIRKLVDEHFLN